MSEHDIRVARASRDAASRLSRSRATPIYHVRSVLCVLPGGFSSKREAVHSLGIVKHLSQESKFAKFIIYKNESVQ